MSLCVMARPAPQEKPLLYPCRVTVPAMIFNTSLAGAKLGRSRDNPMLPNQLLYFYLNGEVGRRMLLSKASGIFLKPTPCRGRKTETETVSLCPLCAEYSASFPGPCRILYSQSFPNTAKSLPLGPTCENPLRLWLLFPIICI